MNVFLYFTILNYNKINAKMSSDSVCRLCLTVDAQNKMFSLIPVQDLYEKVTNNRLHTNKMPVAACYICYTQLKKCYKFMLKSTMAENTLVDLLQTQTDITPKSVCTINRYDKGLVSSLTVTPVRLEIFPVEIEIPLVVKTEPVSHEEVQIKVEVDEDMAVSDEYCEDESEDDNVPLEYIKSDNRGPGSSNAANIPDESYETQVSLPLEVDVQIEEETHRDYPEVKIRKLRSEHLDRANYTKTNGGHYQCKICSEIITLEYSLNLHLGTHGDEKTFECNICNAKFSCKNKLKKHLKSHPAEKPTKCHICHRVCSTVSNLKKHLLTHTGEKPYECNICSRKFSQMSNLKMHLRTHTGEKPFVCNICNLGFRLMGSLMRHERTHTGEKPFECEFCHSTFRQMSTLTRHKRIHTGERPYECHLCDWKFSDSTTLRRHLAIHS